MMQFRRIALAVFVLLLAVLPLAPVPEFWITQANYIGLYTLVVIGLVLLTGIAGLTSFGQAAFVGMGAYTAAYLTLHYGVSPWLTVWIGLAAFMGALSGLLIGPTTTIFYDSGFLIGLKGFVAAIFGGLASYPAAALGAILVGILESFSSFYASAFKEVIVFTLIIPVLLWRSFQHGHDDEEE